MNRETKFSAPWCTLLKGMTAFCAVVLIGIPITVMNHAAPQQILWSVLFPPAILLAGAFFVIRGYELRPDNLLVRRLGWSSRIDLTDLLSAEVDPKAMSGSIRTCGNGGLFCFAGLFRSKRLGSYRAFATDPARSVVLRFPNRTVVVTPGDPEAFVNAVKTNHGTHRIH